MLLLGPPTMATLPLPGITILSVQVGFKTMRGMGAEAFRTAQVGLYQLEVSIEEKGSATEQQLLGEVGTNEVDTYAARPDPIRVRRGLAWPT